MGATARVALADGVQSDKNETNVTTGDERESVSRERSERSLVRGDVDYRHCLSLTAHASVGSFARPLLDYTALDVRYDLGSASGPGSSSSSASSAQNQNPPIVPDARDAPRTAMERMVAAGFDGRVRVESETVTAGITQQILGSGARARRAPLLPGDGAARVPRGMARADERHERHCRNENDRRDDQGGPVASPRAPRGPRPPRVPAAAAAAAAAARNGGTGAREISGSTRRFGDAWRAARQEMAGAELVYGIDCPLPPALGAARLVAWYNVNRGEAQAEMRLFDL